MELEEVSDTIANIEIFSEAFVIDNLVKAELVFEATNTINRTFGLQVEFLDDADVRRSLSFLFTFKEISRKKIRRKKREGGGREEI